MKTVLQCVICVLLPLKCSKLAIHGTVRASPIQENPTSLGYKNFTRKHENSAPVCNMCVLALKMVKIGYCYGTVSASPIQENPTLKYFNKSLTTFCRGWPIKTSPKIMITVCETCVLVFKMVKM